MRALIIGITLLSFLLPGVASVAATPAEGRKMPSDLEALRAYPLAIRKAILEVALHPHLLTEVAAIQTQAEAEFKRLISGLPRQEQNEFYALAHYPKLINEIAVDSAWSPKRIKELLKTYPKKMHEPTLKMAKNHPDLITKINNMNFKYDKEFKALAKDYPLETKQAMLKIMQHPVIIKILTKNLGYVMEAREAILEKTPEAKARLAKLSPELQQANAQVYAKHNLNENESPEAALLDQKANKFVTEANAQLGEVLDPSKAAQMNISYDPYFNSYWNAGPGFYDYPYWYGFPNWGYQDNWWW